MSSRCRATARLGARAGVLAVTYAGAAAVCSSAGCGIAQGEMLYMSGLVQPPTIPAEYKLGDGPVLILIDDAADRLYWAEVRDKLADRLTKQLLENQGAAKIISNRVVERLRRAYPDFESRGCREVGRMAQADQVLWIEVYDFEAGEDAHMVPGGTRMAATVKVIDATEEDYSNVRRWPGNREGRLITVSLGTAVVMKASNRQGIADALADDMAEQIAKLFHDHKMEDPYDR